MKTKLLTALIAFITFPALSQLIISSNTTWSGSVFLSQKVIVNPGVVLNIEPSTNVIIGYVDANGDNIGDVEIDVNGKLNIKGNIICSPVNFAPLTPSTNKKFWKGIKINSNILNDSLFGANISNADMPFNVLSSAIIRDCNIRMFESNGINYAPTNNNVMLQLQSTSIKKGRTGIYQSSSTSQLKADWIYIDSCINAVIGINGDLELKSSKILNSSRLGVSFNDGKLTIMNSRIKKNYAFGVFSSSGDLIIKNSDIDSNFLGGILMSGLGNNSIEFSNIKNNKGAQIEISDYKFNLSHSGTITSPYDGNPTISVNNNNIIGDTLSTISDTARLFFLDYGSPPCGFNNNSGCTQGNIYYDTYTVLGRLQQVFFKCSYFNSWISNNSNGSLTFYDSQFTFFNQYTNGTSSSPNFSYNNWLGANSNYIRTKQLRILTGGSSSGNCNSCGGAIRIIYSIDAPQLRAQYLFGGDLIFNNIRTAVTPQFNFTSNNFGQPLLTNFFFDQSNQCINYSNFTIFNVSSAGINYGQQFINNQSLNLVYLNTVNGSDTICNSNNQLFVPQITNATYNWYLNGNLFTITSTNSYLPPVSGNWNCVVTSSGCQYNSTVKKIIVSSGPVLNISGNQSICQGESTTITVSGASSYSWNNGSNSTSVTLSPLSSTIYSVTGLLNGCSSNLAVPVTVNSLPSVSMNPYPSAILCTGSSLTLTASGASNYVWSNGSTGSTITVNSAGIYSVTGTNNSGCSNTSPNTTVVISNNSPPTPTINTNGSTTLCQGGSITLTSSSSTGNLWSTGATTQSIVVSSSGIYTVNVSNGVCSATSLPTSITVNSVPSPPTITSNANIVFCQGNSISLNSSTSNVIWSNGSTNQSITVNQSGIYTAQASSNGCLSANSNAINVSVNPLPNIPVITALGPTTFCNGGTVTLNSSSLSGNLWSNNSTGQNITVNSSGSYTVTATDLNGCSSTSAPIVINVNPIPNAPTISANGPTTFCSGGNVSLVSSIPNGNLWSNSISSQTNTVNTSGTYYATVTENGCTSPQSNNITVTVNNTPPQPIISANGPTTFCSGNSVVLTSSASAGNLWNNNQISQSIPITNSGTYSVQVTSNGCSNTSNPVTITVNPTPAAPIINASGPTTFCQGSNVTLTTNSTTGVTWTASNGSLFPVPSLIVQSTQSSIYATVTQNGCTSVPSLPISTTVLPIGTPTFTQIQPICAGESFILPNTSNNGYLGTWLPALNNNLTTTYTFTPSAGQCANNQTMSVIVNSLPQVVLAPFTNICDTIISFQLTGGSPSGGVFSGTSVSNNIFNPSVGIGTYPITYTFSDINGCASNSLQNLTVISCDDVSVDENKVQTINIYPNPTSELLIIASSIQFNNADYIVRDISSRIVKKGKLNGDLNSIDLENLQSGSYFLLINNLDSFNFIKK